VIEIKVKWEVVEQALSGEKKKRLAAEKRARQLERKLAQVHFLHPPLLYQAFNHFLHFLNRSL